MSQTRAEQHDAVVAGGIATGIGNDDSFGVSSVGPSEPRSPRAHRVATDYVHAVHPDTGIAVVFVPGEMLPGWLVDEQNAAAELAAAPIVQVTSS